MIFVYSLIIAFIGISILVFIEKKKTQKSVLQIIKNWCSIDSIQFEKNLIQHKGQIKRIKKSAGNLGYKVTTVTARHGKNMRKSIRKKLDSHHLPKKSSVFIEDLKNKMKSK